MRLVRVVVRELLLLAASLLIFRSVWAMLDQYFGASNLWLMLMIGMVVTIVGLLIISQEVECEMQEARKP